MAHPALWKPSTAQTLQKLLQGTVEQGLIVPELKITILANKGKSGNRAFDDGEGNEPKKQNEDVLCTYTDPSQ